MTTQRRVELKLLFWGPIANEHEQVECKKELDAYWHRMQRFFEDTARRPYSARYDSRGLLNSLRKRIVGSITDPW